MGKNGFNFIIFICIFLVTPPGSLKVTFTTAKSDSGDDTYVEIWPGTAPPETNPDNRIPTSSAPKTTESLNISITSAPPPISSKPTTKPDSGSTGCLDGYWMCDNPTRECIFETQVCDGKYDCKNGEDEKVEICGCPFGQWSCNNKTKQCISTSWLCDDYNDCIGGEDERIEVCWPRFIHDDVIRCNFTWTECSNKTCWRKTCNGTLDCTDANNNKECFNENVLIISSNLNGTSKVELGNKIPLSYYKEVFINKDVTSLTMCMWINPFKFFSSSDILHMYTYDWSNVLELKMENEGLYVYHRDQIIKTKVILEGYKWHHLCVLYEKAVSIYFNGTYFEMIHQNSVRPLNLNETLRFIIGSFYKTAFSGKLADIQFYSRILTPNEMLQISTFNTTWNTSIPQFSYTAYANNEDKMDNKEFRFETIDSSFYVMHFNESMSCKAADNICQKFGGQLPASENFDDDTLYLSINKYFKGEMTAARTFWMKNVTHNDTCMKGTMDTKNKKIKVESISSDSTHLQTDDEPICFFSQKPQYYFNEGNGRISFTYVPYSTYDFVNLKENMKISWKPNGRKWIFYNKNEIYGKFQALSQTSLVGRNEWHINSNRNMSRQAIFSTCNKGQFTCSSGTCISMSEVCDFKDKCPDGSDEEFCKVGIEPPDTYEKRLAPHAERQNAEISLDLKLNRIVEIRMDENIITLNLRLVVDWKDGRLKFKNLPSASTAMPVIDDISRKYWNPKISVIGAIDDVEEKLFHLDTNRGRVLASRTKTGNQSFLNGYEVFLYNGDTVKLRHVKTDTVKINCNFNLRRYPFDKQMCNFWLTLKGDIHSDAMWTEVPKGEEAENKAKTANLPLYRNTHFIWRRNPDNFREMRVALSFTRKFQAAIINTFLPCVVLEIIGMLTLVLPANIEYLNNRLILNLSCLIIMAAFFIQVNSDLPPSADPKLIDEWMFAHILLQFVVFIIHIVVIRLHHEYLKKYSKYVTHPKFGELDEIRMPRVGAMDDIVWNFRNITRKQAKKPAKHHLKANTIGIIVFISTYFAFLVYFVVEIAKDDEKDKDIFGNEFLTHDECDPSVT